MKKLTVFNVQFGDCFLLKNSKNDGAMLIDCGSMANIIEGVQKKVEKHLSRYQEKNLLVSHFHRDHYKGLARIQNVTYDNVYLPDFFSARSIRLFYAIFISGRNIGPVYQYAKNLLYLLPNIRNCLRRNTVIHYLKRGNLFTNRVGCFRTLWPENSLHAKSETLYNRLLKLLALSRVDEAPNEHNQVDEPQLEREMWNIHGFINDKIRNFFRLFYAENQEPNDELEEKMFHFREDYREIIAEIDRDLEQTAEFSQRYQLKTDLEGKELLDDISKFQNEISLCFDNANFSADGMLFLSDIEPANFNQIYNPVDGMYLQPYYYLIKVPHHGTQAHFVNNLPCSRVIVISNGTNGNLLYNWCITDSYAQTYPTRQLVCTNHNCKTSPCARTCNTKKIFRRIPFLRKYNICGMADSLDIII